MIRLPSHNGLGAASSQTILLLLLLILTGCDWTGPQTLPGAIVGEWRTDDPRYDGRFMLLEKNQITFRLGGAAPDKLEHIERVKMAPGDKPTEYALKLRAEDGTADSIVLRFTPENGGELRIKNLPKVVWKKEPARTLSTEIPRQEASPRNKAYGEHRTIYKIDCIRPEVCRSY